MTYDQKPKCVYKTYRNIVKLSNEDKLKISYNNIDVERVSTTYIFLWNRGNKPIKKEDIPTPVEVILSDENELFLLDYKIIKVSRDSINFSTTQFAKNGLQIEFDFLDKNDGAVIEVKHTGSINIFPSVNGTILGIPQGIVPKKLTKNKPLNHWDFSLKSLKIGQVIILVALYFPFVFFHLTILSSIYQFIHEPFIPWILLGISLILPPLELWFYIRGINPTFPKSLDIDVDIAPY